MQAVRDVRLRCVPFHLHESDGAGECVPAGAPEQIEALDREHEHLLKSIEPDSFTIFH